MIPDHPRRTGAWSPPPGRISGQRRPTRTTPMRCERTTRRSTGRAAAVPDHRPPVRGTPARRDRPDAADIRRAWPARQPRRVGRRIRPGHLDRPFMTCASSAASSSWTNPAGPAATTSRHPPPAPSAPCSPSATTSSPRSWPKSAAPDGYRRRRWEAQGSNALSATALRRSVVQGVPHHWTANVQIHGPRRSIGHAKSA